MGRPSYGAIRIAIQACNVLSILALSSGACCEIQSYGGLLSSPVFNAGAFNRYAKLHLNPTLIIRKFMAWT
jgi:hypothetical protein